MPTSTEDWEVAKGAGEGTMGRRVRCLLDRQGALLGTTLHWEKWGRGSKCGSSDDM